VSILSDFEDRLARMVEGAFAGAFRSPVQPAEVAKALATVMDDQRRVGVGKVYVPARYAVAISRADDSDLGAFKETLSGELGTYLLAHAKDRGYHLSSRPTVRFEVDNQLKLGRFRATADESAELPRTRTPAEEPSGESRSESPAVPSFATVTVSGIDHDVVLKGEKVEIGRVATCDICLQDVNASRRHAAFVRQDSGWVVVDLGSTNGTLVNGKRVSQKRLSDGDVIQVGITQLVYHEPRG